MDIQYFRISDPLENLKLRIVVRQVSRAHDAPVGDNSSLFEDDVTISWQEKLDKPRYSGEGLEASHPEQEIQRGGFQIDTDETGAHAAHRDHGVQLFTYVDQDKYKPLLEKSSFGAESYVGSSLYNPEEDAIVDDPEQRNRKVSNRVVREKPFKTMHICLATDIDNEALRQHEHAWVFVGKEAYVENVLCSIKVYKDGLMEVTPGFSRILPEKGAQEQHIEQYINEEGMWGKRAQKSSEAPSVYLDDETVKAGVTQGFKLSTYRVVSKSGCEYEYMINAVNDVINPAQFEELAEQIALEDKKAMEMSRPPEPEEGGWMQDPPAKGYNKSISMYAEIVSGKGFQGDRLYINYEVVVPQEWALRTGNLVDGTAEQDALAAANNFASNLGQGASAYTGKQLLAMDGYADGDEARGSLKGTTHTVRPFEPRFGSSSMNQRPKWAGMTASYPLPEGTRYMFGILFFIVCCLAILLGISFPFWLVPGLAFVYTLGTGYPGGGALPVLLSRTKDRTSVQINKSATGNANASRHGSTSGSASTPSHGKPGVNSMSSKYFNRREFTVLNSGLSAPIAHFNHLINLNFDVKEIPIESRMMSASSQTATLLIQVYSIGSFGRHFLEGYGYVAVPEKAGSIDEEIKTWKPAGRLSSMMREQFLGNAPLLRDSAQARMSHPDSTTLNRLGLQTEASGTVRFRCHSSIFDPSRMRDFNKAPDAQPKNLRRSVEDILHNYKSTMALSKSLTKYPSLRRSGSSFRTESRDDMDATGATGTGAGGIFVPSSSFDAGVSSPLTTARSRDGSLGNFSPKVGSTGSGRLDHLADILRRAKAKTSRLTEHLASGKGVKHLFSAGEQDGSLATHSHSDRSGARSPAASRDLGMHLTTINEINRESTVMNAILDDDEGPAEQVNDVSDLNLSARSSGKRDAVSTGIAMTPLSAASSSSSATGGAGGAGGAGGEGSGQQPDLRQKIIDSRDSTAPGAPPGALAAEGSPLLGVAVKSKSGSEDNDGEATGVINVRGTPSRKNRYNRDVAMSQESVDGGHGGGEQGEEKPSLGRESAAAGHDAALDMVLSPDGKDEDELLLMPTEGNTEFEAQENVESETSSLLKK